MRGSETYLDITANALLIHDPWWLVLIKVLGVFVLLLLMTLMTIWFERRIMGRMQHRPGPNVNGPFGLLQTLADAVKLIFKEGFIPGIVDKGMYVLAPIMAGGAAFMTFTIVPMGGQVSMFGHQTALQVADPSVGVLLALAFASVGVYSFILGGWASGSVYPMLGGLRSSAQVISYEIAMGLSFVAVFLKAGSLSMSAIVGAQVGGQWFFWVLPVSFVIYVIAMFGETNRTPFDLPEAESELTGGYSTEYGSMRFALYFLAEYINMINVSALCVTLFMGGWMPPVPQSWEWAYTGWWPFLWFLIKVTLVLFFFIWVRSTVLRFRYDQFMHLGWKVLVPISLAWIVVVASMDVLRSALGWDAWKTSLVVGGGLMAVLAIVAFWPQRNTDEDYDEEFVDDELDATGGDFGHGFEGGKVVAPSLGKYPIPPLDLVVPAPPTAPAAVAATGSEGADDVVS